MDWNDLVNTLGSTAILEHQGWLLGAIAASADSTAAVQCQVCSNFWHTCVHKKKSPENLHNSPSYISLVYHIFDFQYFRSHTLTHSHLLSHTDIYTHSHTLTHSLTHAHAHTHTHTHKHFLSLFIYLHIRHMHTSVCKSRGLRLSSLTGSHLQQTYTCVAHSVLLLPCLVAHIPLPSACAPRLTIIT